ncbi:MAG: FAD-dependent oxidoreductase [Hyphomicrobiales bacterium]
MITASKDLRTGRSIWESGPTPRVPHRRLSRSLAADVLVIGAGITGAMIADGLSESGLSVVIADKRGPAKGSTTASTALVQSEIDTPLIHLARKIGKPNAVRAWRRSKLAVDAISARLREIGVPNVIRRDSLYLAGDLLDKDALANEHDARKAAGLASRFLNSADLKSRFGLTRSAALLSYDSAVIDPRQATLLLLKSACARRAMTIYSPAEIAAIDVRERTATAANGHHIEFRHMVFATGYEMPDCVPRRGHQIISTYAMATAPQKRRLWPEQCTIWEASDPYLYLRTTPDGRIVCGGEDEEFSDEEKRDALLARKTKTLQRKLGRMIRGADATADFAWCGSFGSSATGLPRIGAVPKMPHCWVALGYGGNGTTYARIAADVICGALTGRPDVDADLYDF